MLARDSGVEISLGCGRVFCHAHETIQSSYSVELFTVADLGGIERAPHEADGLVVGLEGNGKRMAILSAMGE